MRHHLLVYTVCVLATGCRKGDGEDPMPPPPNNGWTVNTWNERTHSLCNAPSALMRGSTVGSPIVRHVGRSSNTGVTWQSWTVPNASGTMTFVSDLVGFSRVNSDAYRTDDGGHTWTEMTTDPGFVVAQPGNPDRLFGHVFTNTYLSTDQGLNWTALGTDGPGNSVKSLCFADADTVYALCYVGSEPDLLRRSVDGGQTWTTLLQVNGTLRNIALRDGHRMVMHGQLEDNSCYLYRTSDGWATYDSVNVTVSLGSGGPMLYDAAGRLYTLIGGWFIERSLDNGATWEIDYQVEDLSEPMYCLFARGDTIMASTYWRFIHKVSL